MATDLILTLYSQPQTVFTLTEISLLFPHIPYVNLKRRMAHYVNTGKLMSLRRGIYGKENYNPLELANKLYAPSYISLETVLVQAGVVFQYYETIFIMSYLTRDIQLSAHSFSYHKLPPQVLLNRQGIEQRVGYAIATKERAFLDAVYNYKDYHFDHLGGMNWDRIKELQYIYQSKVLEKRVDAYYQLNRHDYVQSSAP